MKKKKHQENDRSRSISFIITLFYAGILIFLWHWQYERDVYKREKSRDKSKKDKSKEN